MKSLISAAGIIAVNKLKHSLVLRLSGFSYKDFDKVLKRTLPITIYMGVASLAWEILKALIRYNCFKTP